MDPMTKILNHLIMSVMRMTGLKTIRKIDSSSRHAIDENSALLQRLLADNKDTEYGKTYHFADIKSYEDFCRKVPLSTYEDYEPYIRRQVEQGEKNLLSAYPTIYYAKTSGTTSEPKKIPLTDRGLEVFQMHTATLASGILAEYMKNTHNRASQDGFVLTPLSFLKTPLADGTPFGCVSAACLNERSMGLMKYFTATPVEVALCTGGANLNYLNARYGLAQRDVSSLTGAYVPALLDVMTYIENNWQLLVDDIRKGTISDEIRMPEELRKTLCARLKPDPKRADELQQAFEQGFDQTIMYRIWPRLNFIATIWAGNFSLNARRLQQYSSRSVPYYTMAYVASEGCFAVARHVYDQSYAMLPYSCFFEFIPQDDENAVSEEQGNPTTLTIADLEQGKDYELVITNQSGFYRYRMGDIIRVTGFYHETPLIEFKYRKKNTVSLVGEKFTEDHLRAAILAFERRTNINVTDYCMYPDESGTPGHYVIYIEPEKMVPADRVAECKEVIAEELAHAHYSYANHVAKGDIGAPELKLLQQETFHLQRELKMYKFGLSENQLKTPRLLTTSEQLYFFHALEEQ